MRYTSWYKSIHSSASIGSSFYVATFTCESFAEISHAVHQKFEYKLQLEERCSPHVVHSSGDIELPQKAPAFRVALYEELPTIFLIVLILMN